MSAEKRAASSSFSSSQIVKRQKSDTDMRTNGTSSNALIRGVSDFSIHEGAGWHQESWLTLVLCRQTDRQD